MNRLTRLLLALGAGALLQACGGGGASDAPPTETKLVQVAVSDAYGTKVIGATVKGPLNSGTTGADGTALVLVDTHQGTANVTVSSDQFVDRTVTVPVAQSAVLQVKLDRVTAPAGGSMASRSGFAPVVADDGRTLTFEVELIVVDGQSQPVTSLAAADFALQPCTPDAATADADCVIANGVDVDAAYVPATVQPEALAVVAGGTERPQAAALLVDQSGSIASSDPTGARLTSSKAFLSSLGADDEVLLAAFASGQAAIPTTPLTVYGSFRDRSSATGYFETVDALAGQLGGQTPLYDAIDLLATQIATDATVPAALGKAVVVFTDGADTTCAGAPACAQRRAATVQAANASGVRLFTVGLSQAIDTLAMAELANQSGGAFLFAGSAQQLLPLYGSLGRLLSGTLPTYRVKWTVRADAAGTFASGRALLGRARVTVGTQSVDVPFLVAVP